jgi:hypothetical protein
LKFKARNMDYLLLGYGSVKKNKQYVHP